MTRQHIAISFHGIGAPERQLEPGENRYWISPRFFRRCLDEILLLPDPEAVVITFDDGNVSDANLALPELEKRGLKAHFFIVTNRLDQPGSLSRTQVRELAEAGMGIGSHGVAHLPWPGLSDADLRHEVTQSQTELQDLIGGPVMTASAPFGRQNERVRRVVQEAGYRQLFTTSGGPMRPEAFVAPRSNIRNDLALEDFRRLIRGKESLRRRLRRFAVALVHKFS